MTSCQDELAAQRNDVFRDKQSQTAKHKSSSHIIIAKHKRKHTHTLLTCHVHVGDAQHHVILIHGNVRAPDARGGGDALALMVEMQCQER